jgi:phage terminase small subunit
MTLSNKQKSFIAEYLKDHNATQAAIRAGYSVKTAGSIGGENLKKPEIKAIIDAKIKENTMGAEEVLTRLSDLARGDIADLMDITSAGFTVQLTLQDGTIKPQTKSIRRLKQTVTTRLSKTEDGEDIETILTEIETINPLDALVTLAKYHALLTDVQKQTGEVTIRVVRDQKDPPQ